MNCCFCISHAQFKRLNRFAIHRRHRRIASRRHRRRYIRRHHYIHRIHLHSHHQLPIVMKELSFSVKLKKNALIINWKIFRLMVYLMTNVIVQQIKYWVSETNILGWAIGTLLSLNNTYGWKITTKASAQKTVLERLLDYAC